MNIGDGIPLDDSDLSFARFVDERIDEDKDQIIREAEEEISQTFRRLSLNRPPMSPKLINLRVDMAARHTKDIRILLAILQGAPIPKDLKGFDFARVRKLLGRLMAKGQIDPATISLGHSPSPSI